MDDQTPRSDPQGDDTPHQDLSVATAPRRAPATPRPLPRWKVLLHNDDVNAIAFVIESVTMITPLARGEAAQKVLEAHTRGLTLLLTTHRELAELYQEQLTSRRLTVTIEPDE